MVEYIEHLQSLLVPDSEREYQKALIAAYERAAKRINKTKGKWTKARLDRVIFEIAKELNKLNKDFGKQFKLELPELVAIDLKAARLDYQEILESMGVAPKLYSVNKPLVKTIADTIFSYINAKGKTKHFTLDLMKMIVDGSDKRIANIKGIITAGALIGEPPHKIANDIKDEFINKSAQSARMAVRTILATATQKAQADFFESVKKPGDQYFFSAHLDGRTSKWCRNADGKRFPAIPDGKAVPDLPPPQYIPACHFNCRSRLLLVPAGWETGSRPINLMTPKLRKEVAGMRKENLPRLRKELAALRKSGSKEDIENKIREIEKELHRIDAFMKQYIFSAKGNLTYTEMENLFKDLKDKSPLSKSEWIKKLGINA